MIKVKWPQYEPLEDEEFFIRSTNVFESWDVSESVGLYSSYNGAQPVLAVGYRENSYLYMYENDRDFLVYKDIYGLGGKYEVLDNLPIKKSDIDSLLLLEARAEIQNFNKHFSGEE